MNVNLKHWTGTAIVAVLAGFVIFGLLRGQEILNDFLKSEPTDANLERGELLVLIPSLALTPSTKPSPAAKQLPLSPILTPKSALKPSPSLTPTFSPTPTPFYVYESTPSLTPLEAARARPVRSKESLIPAPASAGISNGARSAPLPLTGPTHSQAPTPTPTPILSPTPTPTSQSAGSVVINEIAWMGTLANSADEWIELYNSNSSNIDISGWTLKSASDSKPDIVFPEGSIISALGYFLIERTDDNTIKDIPADLKIGFGSGAGSGLSNSGEILHLYDGQVNLKDIVGHKDEAGQVVPWYFGHNTSKSTMERINPANPGNEPSNWQTNNGITKNGLDAEGTPINGTPKAKNSSQVY